LEDLSKTKQYDKNGEEKKPLTVMEQYYENLARTDRTNQQSRKLDYFSSKETENSVNKDTFAADGSLKPILSSVPQQNFVQPVIRPENSVDVFGFNKGKDADTLEAEHRALLAHQERMEDFKKIWDFQQPAPVTAAQLPKSVSTPSSPSSFTVQHKTFDPILGSINSSVGGTHSPSLTPALPAPTPARVAPPKPDFTPPQRRF
jgi:hypothetical protein